MAKYKPEQEVLFEGSIEKVRSSTSRQGSPVKYTLYSGHTVNEDQLKQVQQKVKETENTEAKKEFAKSLIDSEKVEEENKEEVKDNSYSKKSHKKGKKR